MTTADPVTEVPNAPLPEDDAESPFQALGLFRRCGPTRRTWRNVLRAGGELEQLWPAVDADVRAFAVSAARSGSS